MPRHDVDRRMASAIAHITRDLSDRPTLGQIARTVGLERTYFCKLFHEQLGTTFLAWNRRIRIEESKRLLRTTRLSVTEVARRVGYKDVTSFERNFRRCEARTPRQYRSSRQLIEDGPSIESSVTTPDS